MDAIPAQLRADGIRFVPLFRGTKGALFDGDRWQAGAPYNPILDEFLAGRGGIPDARQQHKGGPNPNYGQPVYGGDIGVRLAPSQLVVLDADVVRRVDLTVTDGVGRQQTGYEDGRAQLQPWLDRNGLVLPRTLMLKSPGREDGSHLPGWHLVYRQNPTWPVLRDARLDTALEVKVQGIVRITDKSEVIKDVPIATLPEEVARKIQETPPRQKRGFRNGEGWVAQGYNNTLTHVKGVLLGLPQLGLDEDRVNKVITYINQLVDDPETDDRLATTVLKQKGWTT